MAVRDGRGRAADEMQHVEKALDDAVALAAGEIARRAAAGPGNRWPPRRRRRSAGTHSARRTRRNNGGCRGTCSAGRRPSRLPAAAGRRGRKAWKSRTSADAPACGSRCRSVPARRRRAARRRRRSRPAPPGKIWRRGSRQARNRRRLAAGRGWRCAPCDVLCDKPSTSKGSSTGTALLAMPGKRASAAALRGAKACAGVAPGAESSVDAAACQSTRRAVICGCAMPPGGGSA